MQFNWTSHTPEFPWLNSTMKIASQSEASKASSEFDKDITFSRFRMYTKRMFYCYILYLFVFTSTVANGIDDI